MEKEKRPAAEVVLTVLHAGGKFGEAAATRSRAACTASASPSSTRSRSGSTWRSAATAHVWTQDYERGKPQADLRRAPRPTRHGHHDHLPARRRDLRDARVRLRDARPSACARRRSSPAASDRARSTSAARARRTSFHYEGGIVDFVAHLNENKDPLHTQDRLLRERDRRRRRSRSRCSGTPPTRSRSSRFANNINTHEGGTHLSGFRTALTRTLNDYAREKGMLKEKDENLTGEDVREGLTAVISVKLARPAVRGPDQDQARQPAMRGLRRGDRQPQAGRVPRGEPGRGARGSSARRSTAARAREAARKARDLTRRKSALENSTPARQARRLLGHATRPWPSSSSSRATPPAARPSRPATATPRRSCRCAARSSTSRRRGSTRSSPTRRSRR